MSALALKVIACIAMLIDHIGYMTGFMPFRIIGRIAFPIFLYLICNGCRHTSSKIKYALRLALFALISQVPFSLFSYNKIWSDNGNVFFTLLMALLCIWSADLMLKNNKFKWFSLLPTLAVFSLYHLNVFKSDYGARAILLTMVFFLFDGKKIFNRILMFLGTICAYFYPTILSFAMALLRGRTDFVPNISQWSLVQIWAVISLIFIFAYNGQMGKLPKNRHLAYVVKIGFYAFYPIHQIVLWAIRVFLF